MTDDREAAIRELFPMVRRLARRVARLTAGAEIDDLVGDGSVGLIRAVDRFDTTRGPSLEAYARRLVLGAMLNGIRRRDPVSERVRRTLRRAEERRFALAQERGSLPAYGELERTDDALRRARVAAHRHVPISLDAVSSARDPLGDWSIDPGLEAVEYARRKALREAIALLPERQQRIIAMHYAADLSLRQIGRQLDVSAQRISQLHARALARLRDVAATL